jgi:hypothetical protein
MYIFPNRGQIRMQWKAAIDVEPTATTGDKNVPSVSEQVEERDLHDIGTIKSEGDRTYHILRHRRAR